MCVSTLTSYQRSGYFLVFKKTIDYFLRNELTEKPSSIWVRYNFPFFGIYCNLLKGLKGRPKKFQENLFLASVRNGLSVITTFVFTYFVGSKGSFMVVLLVLNAPIGH